MTKYRRWTEAEVKVLERWYVNRGAHYVAKRTGRDWRYVMAKARRMGVASRMPPVGFTLVAEVVIDAACSGTTVRRYAQRDGVLRGAANNANGHPLFLYVPTAWAREFVETWRRRRKVDGLVSVPFAADAWKVTPAAARKAVSAGGALLQGVEVRRVKVVRHNGAPAWMLDREDVAVVASRLRALRARARVLVPVKVLAVECSVSEAAVKKLLRERGLGWENLPRGRAWASFTTREAAVAVSERYGRNNERKAA